MIYLIANAFTTSGGPELLHQLCHHLNKNGFEASMVYYRKLKFPTNGPEEPIIEKYGRYSCPYATRIVDSPNNIIIFPENTMFFLPKFKKVKKLIYWLSVDNYYSSFRLRYAKYYAPLGMRREKYNPFKNKYIHCVQSEYARLFLLSKGVCEQSIHRLSDYLSEEFIKATNAESSYEKFDTILYNPKKGLEFTQKIISSYTDVNWVPLINMSHSEMLDVLSHSKVYIDFGNHPGKDRIPREAAICGCCIVTGLEGSAANDIDIPIKREYKFSSDLNEIPRIIKKLKYIIKNYETCRCDFDSYRSEIRSEENIFIRETIDLFSKIAQ